MAVKKERTRGTPQDVLKAALERYKMRGTKKVDFLELVACLKCSSVAQYIDFDTLKTKSSYRWRGQSGYINDWGRLRIMCVMNFEQCGHYIHYQTIPQLIAALEEALPVLERELEEIYKM